MTTPMAAGPGLPLAPPSARNRSFFRAAQNAAAVFAIDQRVALTQDLQAGSGHCDVAGGALVVRNPCHRRPDPDSRERRAVAGRDLLPHAILLSLDLGELRAPLPELFAEARILGR